MKAMYYESDSAVESTISGREVSTLVEVTAQATSEVVEGQTAREWILAHPDYVSRAVILNWRKQFLRGGKRQRPLAPGAAATGDLFVTTVPARRKIDRTAIGAYRKSRDSSAPAVDGVRSKGGKLRVGAGKRGESEYGDVVQDCWQLLLAIDDAIASGDSLEDLLLKSGRSAVVVAKITAQLSALRADKSNVSRYVFALALRAVWTVWKLRRTSRRRACLFVSAESAAEIGALVREFDPSCSDILDGARIDVGAKKVAKLLAAGCTWRDCCSTLKINTSTVSSHVRAIRMLVVRLDAPKSQPKSSEGAKSYVRCGSRATAGLLSEGNRIIQPQSSLAGLIGWYGRPSISRTLPKPLPREYDAPTAVGYRNLCGRYGSYRELVTLTVG
jgi:hypothetical protein